MSQITPTVAQLKRAIEIAETIQKLEAELTSVLGSSTSVAKSVSHSSAEVASPARSKRKKRTMSPEARARIVAAQKARWAKIRGESVASVNDGARRTKPAGAKRGKVRRTMSPESRAKIAAAAKKRWAEKRASQK